MNSIKNIFKITFIVLLALAVSSCDDKKDNPIVYQEISGIENEVMLVANDFATYTLKGGNGEFKVSVENTNVATATLENNTLKIVAGANEGETTLTITSADKTKSVKVKVGAAPKAGVYRGTQPVVVFDNFVKNNLGLWMLENSGNPYDGKRLFVHSFDNNIQKGATVQLNIKAFNIDGLSTGEQSAMVEFVTAEVVKFKIGELSIVVPMN